MPDADEKQEFLEIDASNGGQVLRTSVGLSALTGKPVSLTSIRSTRPKPGLKKQHLTAIRAVSSLCHAQTNGTYEASGKLTFRPSALSAEPQTLRLNIGTAGSVSLVLQAAAFPTLVRGAKLSIIGGTDVAWSPPVHYLKYVLLPVLKKMGANFSVDLISHGYFPKGNGKANFISKPAKFPLRPIVLVAPGELTHITAFSHCASLPEDIARNQLSAAEKELLDAGIDVDFEGSAVSKGASSTIGSGISLFAHLSSGAVIGANALGERGKHASKVGTEAAQNLLRELNAKQPVDVHLADQLIPYMALAKGKSEIACTSLSQHTLTNIAVCEKILGIKFSVEGKENAPAKISVNGVAFKPQACPQ
ncbi:MAG: RNA 3'-terminal phosphate cyclase [Candidatus Diapherotrites archaeon]|nr:RNA 3'-terminal phosphate cyclase [Candidatus Micrarchaeota archaeon]MBU1939774.1 RNA 3'-terminal phosphate cyclase [Candidatus Micrarchaeota archaeon]